MSVISLSANSKINHRNLLTYHFIQGKVLREAKTALSYELWPYAYSDCPGQPNLPSLISFNPDIYPTLQDYLDSFNTVNDVKLAAVQTRPY